MQKFEANGSSGNLLKFLLLEFQISGGIIFREQREGGDRRLTIVTSKGDTFDISRHHRGGICCHIFVYTLIGVKYEMKSYAATTTRFSLEGYSLHSRGYRKEELQRIYP